MNTDQDVAFLIELVGRMKDIIKSHLDRDVSVSEIVSGSKAQWLCQRELEDLREMVREQEEVRSRELLQTMSCSAAAEQDESKGLADKEPSLFEYRLNAITGTLDVPAGEQLEIVREWLRDGGRTD